MVGSTTCAGPRLLDTYCCHRVASDFIDAIESSLIELSVLVALSNQPRRRPILRYLQLSNQPSSSPSLAAAVVPICVAPIVPATPSSQSPSQSSSQRRRRPSLCRIRRASDAIIPALIPALVPALVKLSVTSNGFRRTRQVSDAIVPAFVAIVELPIKLSSSLPLAVTVVPVFIAPGFRPSLRRNRRASDAVIPAFVAAVEQPSSSPTLVQPSQLFSQPSIQSSSSLSSHRALCCLRNRRILQRTHRVSAAHRPSFVASTNEAVIRRKEHNRRLHFHRNCQANILSTCCQSNYYSNDPIVRAIIAAVVADIEACVTTIEPEAPSYLPSPELSSKHSYCRKSYHGFRLFSSTRPCCFG